MSTDAPPPQDWRAEIAERLSDDPEYGDIFSATMTGIDDLSAAFPILGGFYGGVTPDPSSMALFEPYRDGDEFTYLRDLMTTEELVRFQDQMVAMGFARDVIPGEYDDATARAMKSLMAMGNRRGVHWKAVYNDLVGKWERGELDGPEEDDPILVTRDPVALAQTAKASIRKMLGRDPSDDEVQAAASALAGWDLQAAKQQVDLQTGEGSAAKGEVSLIDPEARFNAYLEDRYKPELDRIDAVQTADESRRFTMAQIGSIDRMLKQGP